MDWGRVGFFLSEVRRNFTRNLLMQLTAIGTVTVTILLLGGFVFTRDTLDVIGDTVLKQIEISVFLRDSTSPQDAKTLAALIERNPKVRAVLYVPRAVGLREMRDRLRGQIDTSLLTSNPLPDVLRVRVREPADVPGVAASIRKRPGVANVEYAADAVRKLLRISDVLGRIGLGVVALLIFTAAIIISNTIRLTVYARRREIAIMQLVGASSTYIRWPFICEGFIDGLLGSLLALGLLELARMQLLPKLAAALPFVPLEAANVNPALFALDLIAVGGAVGIIAAWMSVGRYLRT
jgi:cell division transport system permease protein